MNVNLLSHHRPHVTISHRPLVRQAAALCQGADIHGGRYVGKERVGDTVRQRIFIFIRNLVTQQRQSKTTQALIDLHVFCATYFWIVHAFFSFFCKAHRYLNKKP